LGTTELLVGILLSSVTKIDPPANVYAY